MRSLWAILFVTHAAAKECAADDGGCASMFGDAKEEGGTMLQNMHAIRRHDALSKLQTTTGSALLEKVLELAMSSTRGLVDDKLVEELEASINDTMTETLYKIIADDAKELYEISVAVNETEVDAGAIGAIYEKLLTTQYSAQQSQQTLNTSAKLMSQECLERGHTLGVWGKSEIPCTKEKLKNSEKFNKQAQECQVLYLNKALLYAEKVKDCRSERAKAITAWQNFLSQRWQYQNALCNQFQEANAICEAHSKIYGEHKHALITKVREIKEATGPRKDEYTALVQSRCIVNLLKQVSSTSSFASEVSACTSAPIDTSVMEIMTPGLVPLQNCYDVHLKDKFEPLAQTLIDVKSVLDPIENVNTELQQSRTTTIESFRAKPQKFLCE